MTSSGLPASDGATAAARPTPTIRTLIDEFLAEQAATTAVQRFSRHHDTTPPDQSCPDGVGAPAQARYYRDLLPATPPGPGEQYAFEVDLDACSGCKACVVACERLNGLPGGTSFRSVGTLAGGVDRELPVLRNVTTACHHCVEPGCLDGCPVNAYEKDPVTGVVRHLDDQCIGCQYCLLTCPYEVPRFDADRGIVRKCDLCHDRLAEGEAPACVQACPTEAISIRVVDVEAALAAADEPWPFVSPRPSTTVPTTRYVTTEDLRDGVAAIDSEALSPAHAHPPLTAMLVLTQFAVGTLVGLVVATGTLGRGVHAGMPLAGLLELATLPLAVTALTAGVVAMAASVLHLGRPLQAWRAVLGIGHSWLSREIAAFGAFAFLAAAVAGAVGGWPPLAVHAAWLGPLAAAAGLAAVGTSAMVYAVTGRRWWSLPRVAGRFALTTALGGTAVLLAVVTIVAATGADDGTIAAVARPLALMSTSLGLVGLAAEAGLLRHQRGPADDELARTARLHVRHLRVLVVCRAGLLAAGGIGAPWLTVATVTLEPTSRVAAAVVAVAGLLAVVASEGLERWRFFTASAAVRMPGRLP